LVGFAASSRTLRHALLFIYKLVINKLKKILQFIFVLLGIISCKAQEVNGIWMSYRNYTIEAGKVRTSGDEGVIIDFNNKTIGTINTDSTIQIKIDYKKSRIQFNSDTRYADFKVYGKDSIEIDFGENMMHVFRPLNLEYTISNKKEKLIEFLTQNKFQQINENISLNFKNEFHFYATMFDKINDKRFLESQISEFGYWFIKELKSNFFLVFTVEEIGEKNIYQIISLDNCRMELKPMQEYAFSVKNLTELKTCL
jgi:hypothetical protein